MTPLRIPQLLRILVLSCLGSVALRGAALIPSLGFDRLAAFEYSSPAVAPSTPVPSGLQLGPIPDEILQQDGKELRVSGFMLPLRVDGGRVLEFLLLKDQNACCFGRMPRINEWVLVRAAKPLRIVMDIPVTVRGTFYAGERQEAGAVIGIYFMDHAVFATD